MDNKKGKIHGQISHVAFVCFLLSLLFSQRHIKSLFSRIGNNGNVLDIDILALELSSSGSALCSFGSGVRFMFVNK